MNTSEKYIVLLPVLAIILGIRACIGVMYDTSWLQTEILFGGGVFLDFIYTKIKTDKKKTPGLHDSASFILYGLLPSLWIFSITGNITLSAIFLCSILYRLGNDSKHVKDEYFLGLPSPAATAAVLGILIIHPVGMIMNIFICLIAFLTISHIPCGNLIRAKLKPKNIALLIGCMVLPWVYGGDMFGVGLAQSIIMLNYMIVSLIVLLIPHYVLR